MTLDLPTLMVMQSFALACAGGVLLVAWLQNRIVSALALWGVADVMAGAGILLLLLGATSGEPAWSALGGSLLSLQSGLIWKAARTIDAKPAPFILALLGPIFVSVADYIPGIREIAGTLALTMGAAYILAAATTIWLGRSERLAARSPLIIFSAVHGAALLVGTYSTLSGSTGQDSVPSFTVLFGAIYFESIAFALGTAVFVLALVKERNEAAGRMAARSDPLTGIANRAGFMESAERVVARCRHDGTPVSAMMIDLDRFKLVNDKYGHAVGDDVIRKFCEITTAALRPTDVFGRLGGEEFAVVLPGSSIETAYVRAERVRTAFAANCRVLGNHQVDATVSCGVSVNLEANETLGTLLEEADTALYRAKAEGRNRVKCAERPNLKSRMASAMIRIA
jgi:diguanylate cyclase (GGDEF)-like protein